MLFVSDSSTRVQDVFSISRDLTHALYAWSRFERDSPAQELAFLVEAHRLTADVQAELGLGVTVFCLEDNSGGYREERGRAERTEDSAWVRLPLEDRRQRFPRVSSSQFFVAEPASVPKVEPDEEGIVGRRVRIMEEWTVDFPVWGADHATRYGWLGLLDAAGGRRTDPTPSRLESRVGNVVSVGHERHSRRRRRLHEWWRGSCHRVRRAARSCRRRTRSRLRPSSRLRARHVCCFPMAVQLTHRNARRTVTVQLASAP